MNDNLNMEDVKTVINKLMAFIVLDGKNFVSEEEKASYVKSYLNLFIKVINDPEEQKGNSKAAIMEHIFKDMDKYVD